MALRLDATEDLASRFELVVRIVGMKKWHVRLWMAKQLFRLGAKAANMGIKFENKPWYSPDL